MNDIKALGPGCKRCEATAAMAWAEAGKLGRASIDKGTDVAAIASYSIAATPGILIDGRVVHAGRLPRKDELSRGLRE